MTLKKNEMICFLENVCIKCFMIMDYGRIKMDYWSLKMDYWVLIMDYWSLKMDYERIIMDYLTLFGRNLDFLCDYLLFMPF